MKRYLDASGAEKLGKKDSRIVKGEKDCRDGENEGYGPKTET
jgi:hypothetical protein